MSEPVGRLLLAGCASLLLACSKAPVPSGVFLSLSVSTSDVAVETRINGELNPYLSDASGGIIASGPVNKDIREGANEITFALARSGEAGDDYDPWFVAALEIGVKGELVGDAAAGKRLIFKRELSDTDIGILSAGGKIVLSENFAVSRSDLVEIKDSAEMAPKTKAPATGH